MTDGLYRDAAQTACNRPITQPIAGVVGAPIDPDWQRRHAEEAAKWEEEQRQQKLTETRYSALALAVGSLPDRSNREIVERAGEFFGFLTADTDHA